MGVLQFLISLILLGLLQRGVNPVEAKFDWQVPLFKIVIE